jgi:hypothetical protein
MKKKELSEEQYIEAGRKLRWLRDRAVESFNETSGAHRLDSPLQRSLMAVIRKIDAARSDLENECAKRYGDDAALLTFAGRS